VGQKVQPYGFRVGITRPWISRWYAKRADYGRYLVEDQKIRRFIWQRLSSAAVAKIEIERAGDETRVFIHTARPGVVIGKKGAEIDRLREELTALLEPKSKVGAPLSVAGDGTEVGGNESRKKKKSRKEAKREKEEKEAAKETKQTVQVNICEITRPEMEAALVALGVAEQLMKRASFRRAMRKAIETTMTQGAKGIKIVCAGRLGGAEIARTEKMKDGSLPLHTLDADVDYGTATAKTTYGTIGVKVWIYKGMIEQKEKFDAVNA
jgi:small subunit ribosomal protein S3